jgi:polysaccharide pyruvyl transferase WcaK-like protein
MAREVEATVSAAQSNQSPLRLLATGDIGSIDAYHVGDESMMLGLIQGVAACGVDAEWTLMSTRPELSSARYGASAVPRLSFADCAGPPERELRLAELSTILAEPPVRWPSIAPPCWREALAAIAGSDAVVIAGGGNLSRSWPEHVFERTAVVRAARRAARPVAMTGQTIGPAFDGRTRELMAEALAGCVFVGAREEHSYRLALELGLQSERAALQFDEAIRLEGVEPRRSVEIVGGRPFIAVTVNQLADVSDPARIVPKLAAQLAELGRSTGAAVLLVPHVGDLEGARVHDVAMGCAVIASAGDSPALRMAPLPSPEEAVWYCRHAQLVVSTRYHPVVFALGAGTPVLFLYQDRYTLVKGQGALALAGLEGWTLSLGLAASGLLGPAALELWSRRETVREHLVALGPTMGESRRQHVTALLAALIPARQPHASVGPIIRRRGPAPEGEWVDPARVGLAMLDNWQVEREAMERQLVLLERRASTAENWAGVLVEEIRRKEADLVVAHSALRELTKRCGAGPPQENCREGDDDT